MTVVLLADYTLGDPHVFYHPVRFIGRLCVFFEKFTRGSIGWLSLKIKGVIAFTLVLTTTMATLGAIFIILLQAGELAALGGALLVSYFCIAAGDLISHSTNVLNYLKSGDIGGARKAVSQMVGRDTESLNEAEVAKACVESVSENMVDGITAPLFWAFIGSFAGPVLQLNPLICAACGSMAYKAVNTMDSMYGYKNDQYLEFGWFAARVDDLVNYIPARLSGICLVGAAYLLGYDGRGAVSIYLKDRCNSSSPNSGHSESAAAGALGIELGGPASYFGQSTFKEYIGKGLAEVRPEDIKKANRLVLSASLLFFGGCCLIHLILVTLL